MPYSGRTVLGRILIVDDDPAILEVLSEYFSRTPFDVMTVQQGADAVMIANYYRPDAMLLDILMPGMDGVKVLRAIRTMDSSIPVVMLTANGDEDVARATLAMGAFNYVSKPFDFTVLNRNVVAAVAAGADRAWSSFGVSRVGPRARMLTPEEIAAIVRNDASQLQRVAS